MGKNQPLTEQNLKAALDEFAHQRKAFQAEYHLLQQPYELRGETVVLHLHNTVQENLLNELKSELVRHLRQQLSNDNIRVEGELHFSENQPVIYTNREKLNYLTEKNPNISLLVKTLGLDPDF